jgi:hypothetical protein
MPPNSTILGDPTTITSIKPLSKKSMKNNSGALSSAGWKTANAHVATAATIAIVAAMKMTMIGTVGLAKQVGTFLYGASL